MQNQLTLDVLRDAVAGSAAAFRSRTELQPAGGAGDKVFPPTYEGGKYAVEQRRLPGREAPVDCVLLDSVQSQANRMEEALQQAVDAGRLTIPVVQVDFTGRGLVSEIGKITSLQAPHRIADAILRDSLLEGTPFRQSDPGKRIAGASLGHATSLYQLCPTALLFGMWDSTGPKGGLGAKFQRAMVGEIVGIDAVFGVKTSSRIDPLQITVNAGPLYRTAEKGGIEWTLDQAAAKKNGKAPEKLGKDGRPSEANHGNIVPAVSSIDRDTGRPVAGGVTVASAEQMVTLSLPALRRLQFPVNGGAPDPKIDNAGRVVLAALGLCAATLAVEKGFDLRSRCLLWPTDSMAWQLLAKPGESPMTFRADADSAIALLGAAVKAAEQAGLTWRTEPLVLEPSPELLALVKKSQELAVTGEADEQGDE